MTFENIKELKAEIDGYCPINSEKSIRIRATLIALKKVVELIKNKSKKYNHPEVFKFYSEIIQEIEG